VPQLHHKLAENRCAATVFGVFGVRLVLPLLPEAEQYVLGLKPGEIIRKMHSNSAPSTQEEWSARFNKKTDYKIQNTVNVDC